MTDNNVFTIAVSKGYLYNESIKLMKQIGIDFADSDDRKLYNYDSSGRFKLLCVRPWDVPTYVAQRACDLGVVGRDVLLEKQEPVVQLMDLKFGGCSLVIAGLSEMVKKGYFPNMTVATKYSHSAALYFQKIGVHVKLVKLYGAVELAPLTGLGDVICDLTATGKSLKENHLEVMDTVFSSTAHLIINSTAYRFYYPEVIELVHKLKGVVG